MPVARREDAPPLGVVYTPAEIARPMVELALAPLLESARTTDALLSLRICDPALGEGVFLVEVVDVLAARLVAAWETERAPTDRGACRTIDDARRAVRAHCIYGVDVDARAVATARRALDTPHVQVANALAVDWRAMFPGVFARGGFDLVIGNPPYIRQELLADKSILRGFESYDGVADLYVYFIELAHRIARSGGRYCFITPNKWLTVAYGRALRGFLARQASVEGVVDMGAVRVFAEDAFPCIVWGTNARSAMPVHAARGALAARRVPHDRARWTAEPWHIDEPADRALIDELHQRWPAFGDVVGRPSRGIVTGANDVFEIDRATRDRLLASEPAAEPLVRALVKGRDLRPYRAEPADRFILLIDHGTSIDHLPHLTAYLARFRDELEPGRGRKPGKYRWYELQDPVGPLSASSAPRLFYQDIQSAPGCCLDERGLVPDTTVWTLPTSDRFVLAVLNSPLYGWYAQRRFPPALNGAVRPKREYIRALPLATPSPSHRARIDALVEERLSGENAELDVAIADAVLDAYDLTASQRAVVARAGGVRDRTAARRSRSR